MESKMDQLLTKLQNVDTDTLLYVGVVLIVAAAMLYDHLRAKNHGDYFHDYRGAGRE